MRMPPRLMTALQVAISAGLLVYLLWDIPFESLYAVALSASVPLVVLGMMAMLLAHWLDSIQMMWALARQEIAAGSGTVLKINLISMFYSLFLPTMIAGGAIRWYHFAKLNSKPAEALAAILFNRVFETLLLVTFGIVAFIADRDGPANVELGFSMMVALVLVVTIYAVAFDRRVHAWLGILVSKLPLPVSMRAAADKLLTALTRFDQLGRDFHMKFFLLGIIRQVVAVALIMVLVHALSIDVGFLTIAWIRSLMAILILMPISIAGLGIREATFVVTLAQFGVPAESALLLSLLIFARVVLYGLVGGVLEARRVFFSRTDSAEVPR
jgi:glycosyltransferase 2 family protein